MKLSFGIFICLMILKLSSVESATIQCNYFTLEFYGCYVQNIQPHSDERVSIEKAEGQHKGGKTDDDVQMIMIHNADLKLFPTSLNNVFKNLIQIEIMDSGLTEITSEDLKVFPKLKYLSLPSNQIEVIRRETFENNRNLEGINLDNNKISHIDTFSFTDLRKLQRLMLGGNVCNLSEAQGRKEVAKMIKNINHRACYSDQFKNK